MRTLLVSLSIVAMACAKDAEPAQTPPPAEDSAALPTDGSVDVAAVEDTATSPGDLGDTAGPPLDAQAVCEALVSRFCATLAKCSVQPTLDLVERYCLDPVDVVCGREMFDTQKAIASGAIAVSAERLAECEKAYDTFQCPPGGGFVPTPFLCTGFVGLQGVGKPCNRDLECVEGAYCADVDKACPGACAELPGPGSPCINYHCAQGAYCFQTTCLALKKEGESCSDPVACASPGSPGMVCSAGTCVFPKVGDPCAMQNECFTGGTQWLTCRDGQCAAAGEDGDICTGASPFECDATTRCDMTKHPADAPTAGTCVDLLEDGEVCKEHTQCDHGRKCVLDPALGKTVCVAPRDIGEPCGQGEPCDTKQGLVCTANDKICGPPPKLGASCFVKNTGFTQCAFGLYCAKESDTKGTCAKQLGPGAECSKNGVGGQGACALGLVCKPPGPPVPADAKPVCIVQECPNP